MGYTTGIPKISKLPSLMGPDDNNTLSNPFSDSGVRSAATSVGLDPATMGESANLAIQTGTPSSAVNPLAPAADTGGGGWGDYVGAGLTAASTTAQLISQAAQAQAQREFGAQQGDLNRALQAKLAQMQIGEAQYESNTARRGDAYKMLLTAINNNVNATLGSVQNIRNAAQGFDSLLSQAFLK